MLVLLDFFEPMEQLFFNLFEPMLAITFLHGTENHK